MRRLIVVPLLLTGMLSLGVPRASARQLPGLPERNPPSILQEVAGRVKVFIDCSGFWDCDSEYFRTNLTFVDHVRDRAAADVHILITGQRTGSGGAEATLAFLGRGPFDRVNDTLRYASLPYSTSADIREGLLKKMKLGLMRFVSHSGMAEAVQISLAPDAKQTPRQGSRDPWNYWVMRVSLNGSLSGESSSSYGSYSGGASANRVTDAWQISLAGSASYRQNTYDLGDGVTYVSISRDSTFNGKVVKSLGPHWSTGLISSVGSSSYLNKNLFVNLAPAIEFDVFPYSESTRRRFTLQYMIGINTYRYRRVTLFDKMGETVPSHSVNVDAETKQPWGQISASVGLLHWLRWPAQYRIQAFGYLDLRLNKGLSFNVGGGGSWIRDQFYLPKGLASPEEILVRQRQLKTAYSYSLYFGLSYTFGSIFNNIVNPRFGSSGGTTMVMYY